MERESGVEEEWMKRGEIVGNISLLDKKGNVFRYTYRYMQRIMEQDLHCFLHQSHFLLWLAVGTAMERTKMAATNTLCIHLPLLSSTTPPLFSVLAMTP